MHFKTSFVAVCLGVCALAVGQPPAFVSQASKLSVLLCTQKHADSPEFTVHFRDPLTQVKGDKPYRTVTVFQKSSAVAFEPALGMGFGDAEQEMGFEIGNGRVSLFQWLGKNPNATLLFGKEKRDLECKKSNETVEERFRHVPRTYLTLGTPECLGDPEIDPKQCERTVHFRTDGKVLISDRQGTAMGKFSIVKNKARVLLPREGKDRVLQFTLLGDEWQTLRLDQDGTLWKFQPLGSAADLRGSQAKPGAPK